eukprot:13779545-Heterocapsa_arctica.AAC.1
MSNKSNYAVDIRVICDINKLGERPNTHIQNYKQWKYMLNVTGMKHCCDFDGCALGLVDCRGLPVQKPWRVCATTQRL